MRPNNELGVTVLPQGSGQVPGMTMENAQKQDKHQDNEEERPRDFVPAPPRRRSTKLFVLREQQAGEEGGAILNVDDLDISDDEDDEDSSHTNNTTQNSEEDDMGLVTAEDLRDMPPTMAKRRSTKILEHGVSCPEFDGLDDIIDDDEEDDDEDDDDDKESKATNDTEDIDLLTPQDLLDLPPSSSSARMAKRKEAMYKKKNSFADDTASISYINKKTDVSPTISVDANEDSFTMNNSDEFNLVVVNSPSMMSPDQPPVSPRRRPTVSDLPMRIRPSILLFGDSFTEYGFSAPNNSTTTTSGAGWVSLLSNAYTRRADVLNRGFAGYTTSMVSSRSSSLIQRNFGVCAEGVLFSVIWFGGNDAAIQGEPQHVPLDQYKSNLQSVIQQFRSVTKDHMAPILLLTPPPVDETAWQEHCLKTGKSCSAQSSTRTNARANLYGQAVKEAAGIDSRCAVVDVWELLKGETENRGRYLSDGFHLNTDGSQKVYQGIMAAIQKHFAKLAPMTNGKHGESGIPVEERLWTELVD